MQNEANRLQKQETTQRNNNLNTRTRKMKNNIVIRPSGKDTTNENEESLIKLSEQHQFTNDIFQRKNIHKDIWIQATKKT